MTPIFKNILIDCTSESIIGKHMYEYNESRKQRRAKPARKLIGSYFGEKILIYTPLLKWYLSHGMEITQTYSFIKASSHKAFEPFMEAVSKARREGDADKSKAMIAVMMKLDEWSGDAMVSLSSKNYTCYLPDAEYKVKVSAKGVQQGRGRNENVLNPNGFETVVRDRITLQGTNKGFRISKESKSIITNSQTKTALSYYYDKRRVLPDGITTTPLDI
ncbi:hypothetical protein ON010_g11521 [Phytophthora cinnamomi]|nr:hypothetical protein ON010_g11521 [Phytophthora cinnamomi]